MTFINCVKTSDNMKRLFTLAYHGKKELKFVYTKKEYI